MIYRFRVILDNDTKDDIFRDLEITKDSTLKDLNELILLAFKFNGIEMSSETKNGAIFQEVQSIALSLSNKGIIIGLCSKNNANDVISRVATILNSPEASNFEIWADSAFTIFGQGPPWLGNQQTGTGGQGMQNQMNQTVDNEHYNMGYTLVLHFPHYQLTNLIYLLKFHSF